MIKYYDHYINPRSPARAKLSVQLFAKAKSDVSTGQISELIKTLNVGDEASRQAATDLQARLTAAHHDEEQEVESLTTYLLKDLKVAEDKIDAAVAAWTKISKEHRTNGDNTDVGVVAASLNGIEPVLIEDVRDFKSSLPVTAGPQPTRDLSEYEDLDAKL